tara:strand:- start:685 stop:990 length:306 start_codon:yes stop_codon:yes gene_type:complete
MTKRKNIKWTKELDDKIITLRRMGVKPRDIANIMGLPRSAVYSRSFTLSVTKTNMENEPTFSEVVDTAFAKYEPPKDYVWVELKPKPKPKPLWWKTMMWWR